MLTVTAKGRHQRSRSSPHARASRAPFAPAHERPGHASHLLATRTRLSSYP